MMKTKLWNLLLIALLFSCEAKQLYDTKPVAEAIVAEVMGSSGNIYFTVDKLAKSTSKKYFVEFNINDCELVKKLNTEKSLVASYIASQLYKRLDQEIIKKNYGFNIIFDGERDPLNMQKYFFEKKELKEVWKSFNNIDKYLGFISKGDTASAKKLIDNSFFELNIDSLNREVKNKTGSKILATFHTYKHFDFVNDSDSQKVFCFTIGTIITRKDSSQKIIEFLSPIRQANNKIINMDVHE